MYRLTLENAITGYRATLPAKGAVIKDDIEKITTARIHASRLSKSYGSEYRGAEIFIWDGGTPIERIDINPYRGIVMEKINGNPRVHTHIYYDVDGRKGTVTPFR